jgi:cell wall assembly regulator SMI1
VHDGSNDRAALFECYYLMSLNELVDRWTMMRNGIEEGYFEGFNPNPQGPIKRVKWNTHWIPILNDGSGDYICIDLDPAEGGVVGQIILTDHEVGPERMLAIGWREFLLEYADALEEGRFRFDPDLEMVLRIGERWLY